MIFSDIKMIKDGWIVSILIFILCGKLISLLKQFLFKDWIFLGKFCFISEKGKAIFNLSYPIGFAPQNRKYFFNENFFITNKIKSIF